MEDIVESPTLGKLTWIVSIVVAIQNSNSQEAKYLLKIYFYPLNIRTDWWHHLQL